MSMSMSTPQTVPLQISYYYILPLSLPPLPSFPTPAIHYLYIANHTPKIPTSTAHRSLFLVNVPFDATDAHIKQLFGAQIGLPSGRIEDVKFEGEGRKLQDSHEPQLSQPSIVKRGKKRKRLTREENLDEMPGAGLPPTWDRDLRLVGGNAVIMFVDRASMEAVIKAIKKIRAKKKEPIWGEGVEAAQNPLGSSRYYNHHKLLYPEESKILESVNTYMAAFASQEASKARLQTRQRQVADEDGFVMVTKRGRNGPARQDAAQEHAERQKEKKKGLEDFYRFQTREKGKTRARELVRKFEEDKEKIKKMRERKGGFSLE